MHCPHCSKSISSDSGGRTPPWCRHCGADLKATVAPPVQASPAPAASQGITDRPAPAAVIEPSPRGNPGDAPPCFHGYEPSLGGGSNDLFRIYVTDIDLLIFRLGPGSVSLGQFVPQTKPRRYYGTGMVGAIAMWREAERLRQAERMREMLDGADEDMLRDYADHRDGGYAVCPDDLVDEIRINAPSFWIRLFNGAEQEGVLKFHHRTEGRKSLALPTVRDVRGVAEAITRLFRDAAQVNLPWAATTPSVGRDATRSA